MRLSTQALTSLLETVLMVGQHARPVHYLDPGSGSYLLQLLIAGAVGAAFALKLYWKRVKAFFARLFGRAQDEEQT